MARTDGEDLGERLAAAIDLAGRGERDWMACLVELHDSFDADSTVMYAPPHAGRSFVPFLLHKVDLSRIAAKLQAYSTHTPFLDAAVARGLAPGAFFDRDVVGDDFTDSAHHRDVTASLSWTDGLQFVLRLPPEQRGGLVIKLWRFEPKPRFDEAARQLAQRLFPHLLAATKDKFLSEAQTQSRLQTGPIEGLSTPFMVFGDGGRVLYRNPAADNLINAGDVIIARQDRIEPRDGAAARAFQRALNEAEADTAKEGVEIALPRPDQRAPVLAIISVIPKHRQAGFGEGAVAVAYFVDVESHEGHEVQARRAQVLFDLTDAECEVLRLLLDDLDVDEIAARRASAVATVRTQIKAILNKTGSHRQRDLLRFRRLAI